MREVWDYIVIGSGPAGVYAATILRRLGGGKVLLVTKEPRADYARCLLPAVIKGESPLVLKEDAWYREKGIALLRGQEAERVIPEGKAVEVGGARYYYGKLLIATGADPFLPPIKGLPAGGAYTFRNLGDAERIAAELGSVSHAVVLGGGFIGLKVAEALAEKGKAVTVVEKLPWVLPRMLDERGARLVEEALIQNGVQVITGKGVEEVVQKEGRVAGVRLEDGSFLKAELLVVAVGVRPNVGLVEGTSVLVRGGIVVNRCLETSSPGVFAAGDVTVAPDFFSGELASNPIWPNATAQARVAALNMLGHRFCYEGGLARNALKVFGLPLLAAGIVQGGPGLREVVEAYDARRRVYRKLVVSEEGKLLGFVLIGDLAGAGKNMRLMRKQVAGEARKHLLGAAGNFLRGVGCACTF